MTHNETRISNERLAEMLAGLEGVTPGPWEPLGSVTIRRYIDWRTDEAISVLTELQALRAPVEAEPVAWRHRVYFDDTEAWSEWRDGKQDGLYHNIFVEQPLYAHLLPNPSPSDGEVSEEMVERGCRFMALTHAFGQGRILDQTLDFEKQSWRRFEREVREILSAALQSKQGQP